MPTPRRATLNHPLALDRLVRVCALAVLLVGLLVLAGWALKVEALKSVLPGFASMKPNTALGLVLAGIALALRRRSGLRLGCAAAMFVLGGLSLAQDVTGADFGTDQLLFRDLPGAAQTVSPGRMAPITAIDMILLGGALALLGTHRVALRWTLEALALLAFALALPALIGYAYGTQSFYPLPGFGSMALPTALALPLLALGILCARADGLAGVFASPGLGGRVARRFLPLALIAPVLLGWLAQMGENAGLFDRTQDTAVFAAAMMLVLVTLTGRIAHSLEASDAERQRAEATQARLAMIVETSDDAIISMSVQGSILSWNAGAERMFGYRAEEAVGQPITLPIPPQRLHEEEQNLQRLRRGEAVAHYETQWITKDGRTIDVALTTSTLKDADGQVVGASKILRDIGARKQAELALRESEQRLRLATDAAELGIWTWQPEGDRISWENERPYDILGMPRTDAPLTAARFAAEFVHPEDLTAFEQAIAATTQTGARFFYQGRFHCPNGDLRWVEFTGQAVQGLGGPSPRVIGTVRDITEGKRAEQLLRQNRDTFFNLIQNAPFGLYIVDAQFRLRQVSTASQKVFSNIHPLIGRDFEEVLRLVWAEPFVSDALEQFRHTLETGQPYAAPNTTQQRQNIPDIESYDWKIERILLPDGQFGVVCYFYDITERMQAAHALRESEAFSRSIIKSSPDCIKVLDLEGNLLSMQSGQQLLGIEDIRPFLNKSWLDFWTGDDRRAAQAAVASTVAGGAGNFVGFFRTLRGEAKWWDVAISPVLDANGKPTRLLAVSRDITQRQQAAEALRQRTAQFETLVDEAPLGIYLIDADFRIRQVNPTALPVYGNIPDLIGRDFAEVLHILWPEAKADGVVEQFRHTLATGEACFVPEMIEQRADRQTTEYYEWQINRIPLPDGRHGVVCYFRDISERVLAQQKTRESEARYRSLFNSIDAGFCVIEMIFDEHEKAVDYRFLEVNPAFEQQTGLHDATGKRMREIVPEQDENWFEIYGKVALTGEAVRFVSEAKAMDGRWFDVYAFRLGGPESSRVALLFSDITERKRRERNLGFLADLQKVFTPLTSAADNMRVASQRIAELLQLNHCVLAEIDEVAQTATVLHDHHAADAASMVGDYRIVDFLNEAERQELAAGRPLVLDDVRSDERTTQRIQQFEALGTRAMVETSYVVDGRLRFVVAAMRAEPHAWAREDVELLTELAARLCVRVERARAEERLVAAEERMRRAAEAARFGVYDRDLHSAHFHISVQIKQMLGYAHDALLDHAQVMSHFHPDDRAAGRAAYRRACSPAGDGRIEIEQRIVRRDGVVRWVATVGQLLFKDGVPVRSLGFWVDISERKEAEAVLRRRDEELRAAAELTLASKYKSEFLANMSHELRTPLNSLLILSRLLADNKDENLTPKQVEFAQTMHQSGSDLLRLINEILDLSRIEAGQVEVYVEAVGLAKLRENIERDFRHVAQSKQLDFGVSLDPQLPALIRSDANRLEQVLKNLLANSFKFTEKGSVKLAIHPATDGWSRPHASLDAAEGVIAFTVTDSGIGIAPDKQQLIFEAFAQVDGTTSRKYGGTGLGLSISRELASLLGGAITLTSQAGAGSSFTLYLPFTYTAPSAAAPAKVEPTGRQPMAQPTPIALDSAALDDRETITLGDDVLLIVEYDPVFAGLLLDIAHRHAFKGLVASTAAAALQLARQHQPIAITLSVTLPDMDGWTLLQRVNDDLGLRHIPVHIVSGEDERPRGLRQGAASYLQKPASEAVLGALFERIRAAKARAHSLLLVVEDDPAMQRQIVQALGVGADVRTTLVASAEEGLTELKARRYDCVVLDLRLPGMSGYEFLEAVRDELRIDDLPIVVYTGMELSTQQRARLGQLAESVLVKDARSLDRLLDQTSLYLHRRVGAMPEAARATLERLHVADGVLAGTKVLVVDDDMRNVFALFALLEDAGIEAKHAENGIQCLEILAASADFGAVLMDIMMPEMDGYETLRRIRTMKGLAALPVIALTAKAMKGDRERCLEAGATDYLTKPVDPERLLALLRYWVRP